MRDLTIIWDWNGTLLDDVDAVVAALNRMLVSRGAKPTDKTHYRARFGFPVRPFYAELGVDLAKWDWGDICTDFHSFVAAEPQRPRPDAVAALERARALGFRQGVLSAHHEGMLDAALVRFGLRGYFDFVCGTDNLSGESKLDRGRALMARLRAETPRTSFACVGDTQHDAEVARDLGVECLLVSGGHQTDERLAATGFPVVPSLLAAVDALAR
ncbi:MAG: HAD hydrolase-like protein [Kiritimatiellae bacterium]|nr:HAD hydrolase-like protein [Kiritimatiellia bacterium]